MDNNQQLNELKARCTTFCNTAVEQVQGGFVVTAQVQYQDKDTKGIAFTENARGVAHTAEQAAQMSLNYLRTASFDGTYAPDTSQANLFGNEPVMVASAPPATI